MKNKICVIFFVVIILTGVLFSCAVLAKVADAGAQVAGAAGIVDQNTANAISSSAKAIGTAAEEINPEQEYYIGRAVAANILSAYKFYSGNQD